MQEFNALRAKARERRDKAIADAQREYDRNLADIANVEQNLLGKISTRAKELSPSVSAAMPADRAFTVQDVLANLEAMAPGRAWKKRSLDCHMSRLVKFGILRRVRRASANERAVYCRSDLPIPTTNPKTLSEVVREVLTRPMRMGEIVVAVTEAGYQTTMTPRGFRGNLSQVLRKMGYRRDGDKWKPAAR